LKKRASRSAQIIEATFSNRCWRASLTQIRSYGLAQRETAAASPTTSVWTIRVGIVGMPGALGWPAWSSGFFGEASNAVSTAASRIPARKKVQPLLMHAICMASAAR